MSIRMIGLDLDGTTLNKQGRLADETREALEEAIRRGIDIVVSTGRVLSAVPEDIWSIQGLRYIITSNGAHIRDLIADENIHDCYLEEEAVEEVIRLAEEEDLLIEAFHDGKAYIDADLYHDIDVNGSMHRRREYVLSTRTPLDDIYGFMKENKGEIENINIFFGDLERLEEVRQIVVPRLEKIASITQSVPNNIEVGGLDSSKRKALEILIGDLGIQREELMCCGDAMNDVEMIELAGVGVAMGNAWDEVKARADYVTGTNEEDGVGQAVRKFALGEA